jgi:hypothetical protein
LFSRKGKNGVVGGAPNSTSDCLGAGLPTGQHSKANCKITAAGISWIFYGSSDDMRYSEGGDPFLPVINLFSRRKILKNLVNLFFNDFFLSSSFSTWPES